MPDFPPQDARRWLNYSSLSRGSLAADMSSSLGLVYNASQTWPVANKALFVPVIVDEPCTAFKMAAWTVVNSSANIDIGIYTPTGVRLVSLGSTAATNGVISYDIADTYLTPAVYFLALAYSNNTVNPNGYLPSGTGIMRIWGVQEMAAAFPLPAQATFANPAAAFVPFINMLTAVTF